MKKVKYTWRQCIKNYQFHSVFLKNLLLIFLLILLPFTCILGLSTYSYDRIQKSEEKVYKEEMSVRISMDVESIFHEIRNKAIMLGSDTDVESFYRAESIEEDYFYDARRILESLALYKRSSDVVDSVYVYAPYSKVVISEGSRSKYEDFVDIECIDGWEDNGETFQIKYLSRKINGNKKESIVFYYTPNFSSTRNGVVIFNISLDKLKKALIYNEDVSVFIIGNEQLLYDSTMENNGIAIEDSKVFLEETEDVIASVTKLNICGLEVAVRINRQPLDNILKITKTYIVMFVGIVLLLSVLFAFYISRKIFDPFSEILKVIEDVPEMEGGNLLQNKDEVSYIMNSIYATVSRNKNIEEELLERIRLLKKAQAVALQSQINPHFINNTLESVNWMAIRQLGDKNNISEMLTSLSHLLRTSLEDFDTFVTLREEIAYVKKYLFIEQKRLGDNCDVVYEDLEEVEECKVIKMMLQPVVENAIEYGIKPYAKRGKLVISAVRNGEALSIQVQDSGLGISAEKVDEINHAIQKEVIKEDRHIGLSNVNQRIKLAFGDEYGIVMESKIGYGTRVTLNLPCLNDKNAIEI